MRPSLLLGGLTLLLAIASMGGASHCTSWSTSSPEVDLTPAGVFYYYVDNDLCQPQCAFSIWFYEESNGIPGLQRGDEEVDNTCHGMIESDTTICWLLPVGLMTPRDRKAIKGSAGSGAALAGMAILGATAFVPTADAC